MVKVMECPKCSKPFNHKGKYKKHLLSHEGVKPYKCPDCGVSLAAEWILKRHLETKHSGLKPYTCFQCDVSFSSKDHLHRHLNTRKHTPIICEKCNKHFLRISSFTQHRCSGSQALQVENPIENPIKQLENIESFIENLSECNEDTEMTESSEKSTEKSAWKCVYTGCAKEYSTRFNLKTHIRTAHEKIGFVCEFCKSIMMHNHSLQKHLAICKEKQHISVN